MTWAYTTGVLTSTGGTEASPDSLLAGIAIVQAADATRGYRNGLVAWLNNVEVRAANSFISIDVDSQIDLRGSSFINPQNGGVIHDWRSTLIISTTTSRIDAALDFETGSTLLARRERPNDPNPRIVYNTSTRHDYPNIQAGSTPAKVIIGGLDFYGKLGGGYSIKVYFGRATTASVANLRFFNLVNAQMFSTTYNDTYTESFDFTSETTVNTITLNRPTYYRAVPAGFGGNIRFAQFTLNNPTFLNNAWNGAVGFNSLAAASSLALRYSFLHTFKSGLTNIDGVNVRLSRDRQSVNGSPTWTAPNAVITATSGVNGQYTAVNLLDAYREGTSTTDLERFNWTAKARSYNRRTAGETLFANRVLFQHSVNMAAGYSEEVQMLAVSNLALTQVEAAALTGIAFAASGATGGTVTISANHTTANVWAAYRNWISQTANFDSEDTWAFDGTTLNLGAWNVVVTSPATFTTSFVTMGTVSGTGEIVGSYTDAGGTRVTIRTADDLALSTEVLIDGVPQGWQTGVTRRRIFVTASSVVRIYAHAYGYQPRIINITGNTASDYTISLVPETIVDTGLSSATRDTIAATMGNGVDGASRIFLSVNQDLSMYRPDEVLHGLHWYVLNNGATIAMVALVAGDVNGFALIEGGLIVRTPGFYGKVADSVTSVGARGIYMPLYVDVDPAVYALMPAYTPTEQNTSGIVLATALWTQQTAIISALDKADIRNGLATEAELVQRPLLVDIEASTVLAKESTAEKAASNAALAVALSA